jgi:predicted N-acetyltransferase YhbS
MIIKAVETEAEYLASRELSARIFARQPQVYETWRERALRQMSQPGYDFGWHRVALIDGKIVAHAAVRPYRLRYGSVELRVGGIGAVCTDADYRKRGLAAAVMRDALEYMQARGDHLSLLGAIVPAYYDRFGYSTVFPDYSLEFRADAAAALDAPLQSRAATADDAAQMSALYDRCWGHRVTMPRSLDLWNWRMQTIPPQRAQVVEEHSGQIVGYMTGGDTVHEIVVETAAAARTLVAEIGRWYVADEREMVTLYVPPDDRLVHDLRRWLLTVLKVQFEPGGHWMARVIDTQGLRDTLLPEITSQAGLDLRGLIFDVQANAVYIGLRGQDATNVQLEHDDFLQVLFGVTPPGALDLHPDATMLLERLFPPRVAMIAPWDGF